MRTVTFMSSGTAVRAELFDAPGAVRGAVVIAHGSDGVTDHLSGPWGTMMRDYASAFAGAGFTTLLPFYFDKTGTAPGIPAMQTALLHLQEWQDALAAGIDFAAALPGVPSGKVGLVGFSLGGHLSLRLRGHVPVVVEFFAPHTPWPGPIPHPAQYVQIHHGNKDGPVDVSHAGLIEADLKGETAVLTVHRYDGAGHGFKGTDRDNTEARKLSKERTLQFVAKYL